MHFLFIVLELLKTLKKRTDIMAQNEKKVFIDVTRNNIMLPFRARII
jgi:hypothetical protein